MINYNRICADSTLLLCILPLSSLAVLSVIAWCGFILKEKIISRIVASCFLGTVFCGISALTCLLLSHEDVIKIPITDWFEYRNHVIHLSLVADRLSIFFVVFSAILVGLIGAFSERYLHRESGYGRFYLLLSLFGAGVNIIALAGSLELLFIGWELVGVSSALLIAFFEYRQNPVEGGFRAFITYRICDAGLLAAVVWLNHSQGTAAIDFTVPGHWATINLVDFQSYGRFVALCLVFASLGKAAQFPFSGWLPKAMEGPTPSSAIFYGAISVHLGPFLLLRSLPLLQHSVVAQVLVVLIGAITAIHATCVGRVQTDIKSQLSYAAMAQVGTIFVEIGLGFYWLALFHIVGHAFVRTLQILRSPNILKDYHYLEQAVGSELPQTGRYLEQIVPKDFQNWAYRFSLERSYIDAFFSDYVLYYWNKAMVCIDHIELLWTDLISDKHKRFVK